MCVFMKEGREREREREGDGDAIVCVPLFTCCRSPLIKHLIQMGGATPPTNIRCLSRLRTTLRRTKSRMFGQYQLKKHTRMKVILFRYSTNPIPALVQLTMYLG